MSFTLSAYKIVLLLRLYDGETTTVDYDYRHLPLMSFGYASKSIFCRKVAFYYFLLKIKKLLTLDGIVFI